MHLPELPQTAVLYSEIGYYSSPYEGSSALLPQESEESLPLRCQGPPRPDSPHFFQTEAAVPDRFPKTESAPELPGESRVPTRNGADFPSHLQNYPHPVTPLYPQPESLSDLWSPAHPLLSAAELFPRFSYFPHRNQSVLSCLHSSSVFLTLPLLHHSCVCDRLDRLFYQIITVIDTTTKTDKTLQFSLS